MKKKTTMPTIKQKKAVDNLVGNGGNVTRAMREAGYAEDTLNTPQKLTESKGFKELMAEYGLTEGLITKSLVADINKKPGERVKELNLGAEILGMKQEKPPGDGVTNNFIQIVVNPPNANPRNKPDGETVPRVAGPSES